MMATIEDILNNQGIAYRDKGTYILISCLSPDHEDIHPSFSIHKHTGFGKCYSCGYTVNVFRLFNASPSVNVKIEAIKEKMYALQRSPNQQYPDIVDPVVRPYRGISAKVLKHFNAFTSSTPGWENRIWFPLRDTFKNITAFYGRHLSPTKEGKILILPRHAKISFFPFIPKPVNGTLVLVEGLFDVLTLIEHKIYNVASLLNFPGKKDPRLELLKLYGVHTILLGYDGDSAGKEATRLFKKHYGGLFSIIDLELDNDDWNDMDRETLTYYIDKIHEHSNSRKGKNTHTVGGTI